MLNMSYVTQSICDFARTAFLAKAIRSDAGKYTSKRPYLYKWNVSTKLQKMGYSQNMANTLASYFIDCVESAFERGVFVVSSRTISSAPSSFSGVDNGAALVTHFKNREPEYFDPVKWYSLSDFEYELRKERYCDDIIMEFAPFVLLHVRAAFAVGINQSAARLVH